MSGFGDKAQQDGHRRLGRKAPATTNPPGSTGFASVRTPMTGETRRALRISRFSCGHKGVTRAGVCGCGGIRVRDR